MFNFSYVDVEWYWLLLTIFAVMVVFALIGASVAIMQRRRGLGGKIQTTDIVYAAICIAISFALSLIPLPALPQGGSITVFSTVPIMIFCYYFGFSKGVIVCFINMILQFIREPMAVHPFSFALDYTIPYMALSIIGLFAYNCRKTEGTYNLFKTHYKFFIGGAIYILVRYASHVFSGIIFYSEFAGDKQVLIYSLGYNTFALVDFAVAIVGVIGLLSSNAFNAFMASHANALQYSNAPTKNDK